MAIVTIALHHQILEHPALVRMRDHIEPGEARARDVLRLALPLATERILESLGIAVGLVLLESIIVPIRVERGAHALDDRGGFCLGQAHVPLKAGVHCGMREVGGADERGGQSVRSVHDHAFACSFVRWASKPNSHLRAELTQGADSLRVSDPHVRRCDHSNRAAPTDDAAQFVEERDDAAPHDEGTDQVHSRRTLELGLELRTDRRLLAVVDQ